MLKKIIFVLLCSFTAIAAPHVKKLMTQSKQYKQLKTRKLPGYKVIKTATQAQVDEIVAKILLKKNWPESAKYSVNRISSDGVWYIADINNDGKPEYVFINYEGSGSYLHLIIFQDDGDGLKLVDSPLRGIDSEYFNPFTNKSEIFVKVGKKVFICGKRHYVFQRRILYWEKNKCIEIVNPFWIKQQHKLFKQLYQAKRYYNAYSMLHDFESRFRQYIDPQIDLWMQSDLSLTLLRAGLPYSSLESIKQLKKDKTFANAKPALKRAVECNEKLVQEAIEEDRANGTKGKYNYEWLLDLDKNSNDNLSSHKEFYNLLATAVPNCDAKINDAYFGGNEIYMNFLVSSYNGITIENNRYAYFSGWWPHNACSNGFFWCDMKEKISLIATDCIYSRSLFVNEIPKEFYAALAKWIKENKISYSQIIFEDRLGKQTEIDKTLLGIN